MNYPLLTRSSVIECPVHGDAVALNDEGRIASRCHACEHETQRALWRWQKRRQRASTVSTGLRTA